MITLVVVVKELTMYLIIDIDNSHDLTVQTHVDDITQCSTLVEVDKYASDFCYVRDDTLEEIACVLGVIRIYKNRDDSDDSHTERVYVIELQTTRQR
jgi:hypothetical protein